MPRDNGRSGYRFYSESMNASSCQKLSLANDLRKTLGREEFCLSYQPKVDGQTKAITGAEALIRWRHPSRGLVAAGEFIPIAEETGLIQPLGEWVLRTACQQIAAWQKAGIPAVPVAGDLGNMTPSLSFITGDNDPYDHYSHGTHVAGIIAGSGADSGPHNGFEDTYKCIAPSAKIINLRVLDQFGLGRTSDVLAALDWCIKQQTKYRIKVINLSLGHPVYESYESDPL